MHADVPDELRPVILFNGLRKGTNGVSTNGVTAIYVWTEGLVWVLPLTYFYIPKSARAYPVPQSVKFHYFSTTKACESSSRPRRRS